MARFMRCFVVVVWVLTLSVVGVSSSVIIPSTRCRDASESLEFRHITGDSDSCCDTYELRGATSQCHFHFFTKEQSLSCLSGKHIIVLGGSWQFGLGMGLFQLMKPANYPVDPDEWLDCEGCELQTTGVGSVTMADIVLDEDGTVLSTLSVQEDALETGSGELSESSAQNFIDDKMANAPFQGKNGVRITFARIRYYDAVAAVVNRIWERVEHEGQEPVVVLGLRGWWYTFCSDEPEDYCPRSDSLKGMPSEEMEGVVSGHVRGMFSALRTLLPGASTILVNGDKQTQHKWLDDAIKEAISIQSPGHPFKYVIEAGNRYTGGIKSSNLHQNSHPNNKQNQMLVSRMLNVVCESAGFHGDIAIGERITFQTEGCSLSADRDDNWARHYYQPCQWEPELFLPDVIPDTPAPTVQPTSSPVVTGCRLESEQCASPDDCCSGFCNSLSNVTLGNLTTLVTTCSLTPTSSPTTYPTLAPTSTPAPTAAQPLYFEILNPEGWSVSSRASPLLQGGEVERFATPASAGMDDSDFRVMLVTLSFLVILPWLAAHLVSEEIKEDFGWNGVAEFLTSSLEDVLGFKMPWNTAKKKKPVKEKTESPLRRKPTNPNTLVYSRGSSGAISISSQDRELDSPMTGSRRPKEPAKPKSSTRLEAFGMARYVASVHIVTGHLVRKDGDVILPWHTSNFGFTWVPWFMMLSGFILTFGRATSRNPDTLEPWYLFTAKRVKSIYPLYLSALFARAAMVAYQQGSAFSLGEPGAAFASLFLLQAWVPTVTEHVFQEHCWFLSCIVPYWALHNQLYRAMRGLNQRALWLLIGCLTALPWLFFVLVPLASGDLLWFQRHLWQGRGAPLDIAVVMLKYHPFFYLHIYAYGMALAHAFVHLRASPPFIIRWGTTLGYLGLYLFFSMAPFATIIPAAELSCRLGVLAPLQGLSLLGLAAGVDPLSRLFAARPLRPLGDISYPQYIFQFIAHHLWGTQVETGAGFWLVLVALSVVGFYGVQKPLRPWKVKPRSRLAAGGVMMLVLPAVLTWLLRWRVGAVAKQPWVAPAVVRYSDTAVDVEVPLGRFAESLEASGNPLPSLLPDAPMQQARFINPSVLWNMKDETFSVFARRHVYRRTERAGFFEYNETCIATTVLETSWYSDIVWANVSWTNAHIDGEDLDEPEIVALTQVQEFNNGPLCETMVEYHPHNHTVSLLTRVGPEDPRVVRLNEQSEDEPERLWVTFNRLPSLEKANETELKYFEEHNQCESEVRMSVAEITSPGSAQVQEVAKDEKVMDTETSFSEDSLTFSVLHTFGTQGESEKVKEKNWMTIVHPSDGIFFIRSLHPFILSHFDGKNQFRDVYSTEFPRFAATVDWIESQNKTVEFHGGSNAVYVGKMPGLEAHYLAAFHTLDSEGVYTNFLMELETEPPFLIRRFSRALPLLEVPAWYGQSADRALAFASGLAVAKDPKTGLYVVVVAYGSSNAQSRLLRLSPFDVRDLFHVAASPTPRPTSAPTLTPSGAPSKPAPTSAPTVRPAGRDELCSHPDAPTPDKPECEVGLSCVYGNDINWAQCILCANPQFNWDCPHWDDAFVANAESVCELKCTSSG